MNLPQLTAQGRLPAGRYRVTLDELRTRFVDEAPEPLERDLVYRALELHLSRLVDLAGPSTVWVDGGFVTHKTDAPKDVDVVYWCRDSAHLRGVILAEGVLQLLTLQGVAVSAPLASVARRIQPMGGLVDVFLATPARRDYWHAMWSSVKDEPGEVKGYVEVEL